MPNDSTEEFLAIVEPIIGHPLQKRPILEVALTHRSYVNETSNSAQEDNERLEFLGDAVLNLAISDLLMERYPEESEGVLSKYRSSIVNERSLAFAARNLQLGRFIRLGKGEELTQGREKDSILANTFEAVVAALYLSGGLEDARAFVSQYLQQSVIEARSTASQQDYKTTLQELVQRVYRTTPSYRLVFEGGPDHEKIFESEVLIEERVYGKGRAKSKKDAEQRSAEEALVLLQSEINHSASDFE